MSSDARTATAPYHQQDLMTFCGPATAQMILAQLLNGELIGQGVLKATLPATGIPEKCTLGDTSPEQLCYALNQTLSSRGFPQPAFEVYYAASAPEATALLAQTLAKGTAAAALTMGGDHWVAVTAVTGSTNQPASISLNNPWPPVPRGAPLDGVHAPADGCGTGSDRGSPENVSLSDWYGSSLTAVTRCAPPLDPQPYIVIGASGLTTAAPESADASVSAGDRPSALERALQPPERVERGTVIERSYAVEIALRAIVQYGLREDVTDVHAERPRLVKRLDLDDELYYIVPLRWRDGTIVVVRIDALRGVYLGAQTRAGAYRIPEPAEVSDMLRSRRVTFSTGAVEEATRYDVGDVLGWAPSQESRSPYHPFSQVTCDGTFVGHVGLDMVTHHRLLHELNGG